MVIRCMEFVEMERVLSKLVIGMRWGKSFGRRFLIDSIFIHFTMARAFTNEFNLLANTQPEWKGAALQYRQIVDFFNRSRISYAISADPTVSRPYLEQFWETAEHDCTVSPNVIRATVDGRAIAFSEDTIRRVLRFGDLATDPTSYPDYYVDGCWRHRMGYVGARDYASYKKMWVLDQWRYFAHVMIVCISSRKAGKDAMGHDLAAAMVGLSLNRGYNFSRYIFKAINDQINTAEKFRFLLYPSVDPTPVHTELFGHLLNEAYVAPEDWNWYSPNSAPEMSDDSDEQQEEMNESDGGDDEGGDGGAEESDSEATESDSSDSDDAPSQAHPRKSAQVTLPASSSKRKRQSSSSEYEPTSDSDAALQRQRRESANKKRGDRQEVAIPRVVEIPTVQQVQAATDSPESESTPPAQQLYRRRRRPLVQGQPFNYGDFSQGFDFDTIFSSPIHNIEASSSWHSDPNEARINVLETQVAGMLRTIQKSKDESDAQQAQINSLADEVRILHSQRTGTNEQLKNGEKEKEKENKSTGAEPCHPVDLTKDDDKDKDPEAGPSGGEHQALAIVPISSIPMAEGESTQQEGGDTSGGGGDKGKSAADVLKYLSDDEILYLEPDYSKEAQIDALLNLEEGEIDSGDDWNDEDEDVVIEIPKGDGEGEYELEDGEIFEVPSLESLLETGSVDMESNVEATTEASPVDPTPVDPEAPKDKDMPSASSKGLAPVRQKTSITELQWEARTGKFEYFKPQVPRRVKDKHAVHPDILGDMWYWYVDPKIGEAVVMGKGKSASGNMVPKEVIRIFDEVYFINFSVNDLEVLVDKYCIHTDEWTKLLSAKYGKKEDGS
ncbi:hypothetical protein L1987_80805 [Smallanthus sonchifolius]|uniref:Uncharacterized protein n=1 Tax=Smallanthus sonchifolius TaxID=185202 RepID=A0ACB8YQ95_9ASTR|nr:hypothetical protein L1987_80805 [Smallanthus sonchifolius]